MWLLLGYVDDLPKGRGLADGTDLGGALHQPDKLARIVKCQDASRTLTEREDPIEEIGEQVEEEASIHGELLLHESLG